MPICIPPGVWSQFSESPAAFVTRCELTELSEGELDSIARRACCQVTLPASLALAQKLGRFGIAAHTWELSFDDDVLVSFKHSNFIPYFWELHRRRRTARLESKMALFTATHKFYSNHVSGTNGKVPLADLKPAIARLKTRLRQLQKAVTLRRVNVTIVAVKIEVVVDITHPELEAHVHAHCIFAIPKAMRGAQVSSLETEAAALTGLKFGELDPIHGRTIGYFLKHPVKLDWGADSGHLTSLNAAARLTPSQAVRIFRATSRVAFFSTTRSQHSSLSPSIGRLIDATEHQVVHLFVPPGRTGAYLAQQARDIERQRRVFERLASRTRRYPLNKSSYRTAFKRACRAFWADYLCLRDLGLPTCPVFLNRLGPRPSHRRPPDVSRLKWGADLRRIRRMRSTVSVIEIEP